MLPTVSYVNLFFFVVDAYVYACTRKRWFDSSRTSLRRHPIKLERFITHAWMGSCISFFFRWTKRYGCSALVHFGVSWSLNQRYWTISNPERVRLTTKHTPWWSGVEDRTNGPVNSLTGSLYIDNLGVTPGPGPHLLQFYVAHSVTDRAS